MMKRIEERQLVTMNSLERRCANLEAKCNSLENELGLNLIPWIGSLNITA
jgi:hypothetical protein